MLLFYIPITFQFEIYEEFISRNDRFNRKFGGKSGQIVRERSLKGIQSRTFVIKIYRANLKEETFPLIRKFLDHRETRDVHFLVPICSNQKNKINRKYFENIFYTSQNLSINNIHEICQRFVEIRWPNKKKKSCQNHYGDYRNGPFFGPENSPPVYRRVRGEANRGHCRSQYLTGST